MKTSAIIRIVGSITGALALFVPIRIILTGNPSPDYVNISAALLGVVSFMLLGPLSMLSEDGK